MKVPDKVLNKDLYIKVREEIKKQEPKNSAYRSVRVVELYKKRGGLIDESKEKTSGLKRWLKEKWIVMEPYVNENKKVVSCGSPKYIKESACRPLKRISKDTPLTADEVLKKHSKAEINKALKKKNKNPQGTILQWKTLNVVKRK